MPHVGRRPRLYYEREGSGEPMLWITGFTISAAVFRPILHLYTPTLDCITYDNRGSGRSSTPLHPTSVPELAGDAVRLLDALGIESAHVYGLSMGGMIAQELAIRFPERVRGLVLGCTTPGGPRASRPGPRQIAGLGLAATRELTRPGRPWLGPMLFSERFLREHPERARELIAYFAVHRAPVTGMSAHWWASVYHDTFSRLSLIQAPTLVLHGGQDRMSPLANSQILAERIPDAELGVIDGAGHAFALECPQQSARVTLEWLERRAPIAPGRRAAGLEARGERLTRALGLPVGALRTGRSLAGVVGARLRASRHGRPGSDRPRPI